MTDSIWISPHLPGYTAYPMTGYDKQYVAIEEVNELKKQIKTLKKGLEVYERERNRYAHATPEMSGMYFLAGGIGEKDSNQLPKFVEIVPAYGCGWSQLYERTEKTISYEGS